MYIYYPWISCAQFWICSLNLGFNKEDSDEFTSLDVKQPKRTRERTLDPKVHADNYSSTASCMCLPFFCTENRFSFTEGKVCCSANRIIHIISCFCHREWNFFFLRLFLFSSFSRFSVVFSMLIFLMQSLHLNQLNVIGIDSRFVCLVFPPSG